MIRNGIRFLEIGTMAKEKLVELDFATVNSLVYDNYRALDEKGIEELMASIKEVGVREPITLKEVDGKLTIIAGHHRVEAIKRLKKEYPHIHTTVKAIVTIDQEGVLSNIQKVISNSIRRDNIIDRAAGYNLLKESGKTIKQISEMVGKDRTTIENHLYFYEMYKANKELFDGNMEKLKESYLYKLAYKFKRDPDLNVGEEIGKQIQPKEKGAKKEQDRNELLLGCLKEKGFGDKEVKDIISVLRKLKYV
jgi:ParB/RepB/Spo0J family partition protein